MEAKLNQLKTILAEVSDLEHAAALLSWDQQAYMPRGSAESRSYQMATLERLAHNKFTTDEVGKLLEELKPLTDQLDPDSEQSRLIKVTTREYQKQLKIPADWVENFAKAKTIAHQVWEKARDENDFASFRPYLEQIVDLRRQYADFFTPYVHVYDPLLDHFEPGMKTAEVKSIFETLRPQQVALIKAISEHPQVDNTFLRQSFDVQKQWDFGVEVITRFGYDWQHGRLDQVAHPFTISFGIDDVRITTRLQPDYLSGALFGTMHECGHALYELGIDPSLSRSPLGNPSSLAIHESQSRMWENLVGRSLPFWTHFYPRLQEVFPSQLANVDLATFYKGINKVQPSLIRIEADEATYNLHIMLRLEIEIALIEGSLQVKDLPEAWNTLMGEYLGLIPPNDSAGVLQDVHWSGGMIGYFSTYALGNLISVQLWERIQADIPEIKDQICRGEFAELRGWLGEKIHRHGAKFEPQELVQRVTGSKIDPSYYMRYLEKKFGEIYAL